MTPPISDSRRTHTGRHGYRLAVACFVATLVGCTSGPSSETATHKQSVTYDFGPGAVIEPQWRVVDPVGDSTITLNSGALQIDVAGGSSHDLWTSDKGAARVLLQEGTPLPAQFEVEATFETLPSERYQMQGLIIQQDDDTFLRLGTYHDGSDLRACVALIDGSAYDIVADTALPPATTPLTLHVARDGDGWVYSYAHGGGALVTIKSFTRSLPAVELGVYAGNTGPNPAFTSRVDQLVFTTFEGSGEAGSPDAGSPDSGSPDSGSPDSGSVDAGSPAPPLVSDAFDGPALGEHWEVVDPAGDVGFVSTGSQIEIDIPGGVAHDLWTGNQDAPRLLQPLDDGDFAVEAKFESIPSQRFQDQGLVAQAGPSEFVRASLYHDGTNLRLFAAHVVGGAFQVFANTPVAAGGSAVWLRLTRSGDTFEYEYSFDGTSFSAAATIVADIDVQKLGPYGGNAGPSPAFVATVDYFSVLSSPVDDADGPADSPQADGEPDADSPEADGEPDAGTVAPFVSDAFDTTGLHSRWRVLDPRGDVDVIPTGWDLEIDVPGGVTHDLYAGSYDAPRVLQTVEDDDFAIEVKFNSTPSQAYQMQGIVAQADDDTLLRCGLYSTGGDVKAFVGYLDGGSASVVVNSSIGSLAGSVWLRLERSGNDWSFAYSTDGTSFITAAAFTQGLGLTELGVYAGNAGAAPAFTARVDYAHNLASPLADADQAPPVAQTPPKVAFFDCPEIEVIAGLGQRWVNVLGNVSDPDGIADAFYSVDGGPASALALGADGLRLHNPGDFNIELDGDSLALGDHIVEVTAIDGQGLSATRAVTVHFDPGPAPGFPYTIDWTTTDEVSDVAQVVDGEWELSDSGLHTAAPGYDRAIAIGDRSWPGDLDVTLSFTLHSSFGVEPGVGVAFGWQGHQGDISPRVVWPLEVLTWVRNAPQNPSLQTTVYPYAIPTDEPIAFATGVEYLMRSRTTSIGADTVRVESKVWPAASPEPSGWTTAAELPRRDGSLLLLAHRSDVTFGFITVDEVP